MSEQSPQVDSTPKELYEGRLSHIVQMLNHEGDLVWSRYNAFLTANGFLASMLGLGFSQSPWQFTVLSIAGLFLCRLWWWITFRGFEQCRYYLEKAQAIESQCGPHATFFQESAGFGGERQIRIDYCSMLAIQLFGVLYVMLLLIRWLEFTFG